MSHMVRESPIVIKNLSTLKRACQALGMEWREGQTTARYWGGEATGYRHAIKVPGTNWEIGVKETAQGEYALEADFYGQEGKKVRGAYNRLLQRYSSEEVKRQARLKGYSVKETRLPNGQVRLEVCL